jgi:hypothetical protein
MAIIKYRLHFVLMIGCWHNLEDENGRYGPQPPKHLHPGVMKWIGVITATP